MSVLNRWGSQKWQIQTATYKQGQLVLVHRNQVSRVEGSGSLIARSCSEIEAKESRSKDFDHLITVGSKVIWKKSSVDMSYVS